MNITKEMIEQYPDIFKKFVEDAKEIEKDPEAWLKKQKD